MMLSHWPCHLHPFIRQISGDAKEPIVLFEKSWGSFPGGVVYLSHIINMGGLQWSSSYMD